MQVSLFTEKKNLRSEFARTPDTRASVLEPILFLWKDYLKVRKFFVGHYFCPKSFLALEYEMLDWSKIMVPYSILLNCARECE